MNACILLVKRIFVYSNKFICKSRFSYISQTFIYYFIITMIETVKTLFINKKKYNVEVPTEMPLLWFLRDIAGLTGTKFGCGMAQCGACTVHLDGEAMRSCVTPVARAIGKEIITIEGLSLNGDHPLQKAWTAINVPQCGYCQSGQIMSAAVLLRENSNPTDQNIDDALSGNICRCGTYLRIREAIHIAAADMKITAKQS